MSVFTLPADSLKGIGGTIGGAATDVFKDTAKLLADLSKVVKDVTLPVFRELAKVLDAALMPPLKAVGKAFADAGQAVGDGLKWVGSALTGFGAKASDTAKAYGAVAMGAAALATAFSGGLVPAVTLGGVAVVAFGKAVGREFPQTVKAAKDALAGFFGSFPTTVADAKAALGKVGGAFAWLGSALTGIGGKASDTAKTFGAGTVLVAGFATALSGGLIPALGMFGVAAASSVRMLAKEFPDTFRKVSEAFGAVSGAAGRLLGGLPSAVGASFRTARDVVVAFGENVIDRFRDIGKSVANALGTFSRSSVGRYFAGIAEAIGESLGKLRDGIADKARALLDKLPIGGGGYRAGGTPGGAVGNALATVAGGIGDVAKPALNVLGGLAKSFGAITGVVAGVGSAIGGLVEKANPAVFQQFELALNDVMGVIGQALVPVMRVFTEILRMAGDTLITFSKDIGGAVGSMLTSLTPIIGVLFELFGQLGQMVAGVMDTAAPVIQALATAVLEVMKAFQPLIDLLIDVVGGVMVTVFGALADAVTAVLPYIVAVTKVFGDMVGTVVGWVRDLLVWIGLLDDRPDDKPGTDKGASVGAATRSASISSVADTIAQAQKASYSLGVASAADPKLKVANSIDNKVTEVVNAIKELPRKIATAIKEGASDAVDWASDKLMDAGNSVTDTLGLTSEESRKEDRERLARAVSSKAGEAGREAFKASVADGKGLREAAADAMAAFLARRDGPGGGGVVTGVDP